MNFCHTVHTHININPISWGFVSKIHVLYDKLGCYPAIYQSILFMLGGHVAYENGWKEIDRFGALYHQKELALKILDGAFIIQYHDWYKMVREHLKRCLATNKLKTVYTLVHISCPELGGACQNAGFVCRYRRPTKRWSGRANQRFFAFSFSPSTRAA